VPGLVILVSAVLVFYRADRQTDRQTESTQNRINQRYIVGVKPGFHSNTIACVDRVRCVRCVNKNRKKRKRACVGKQPIMVATASTEHSYWLALSFVAKLKGCKYINSH